MTKAGQRRRLELGRDDLDRILRIHDTTFDTLDLLASPLRGSDYDGNVRSGISDPTPAQAFELTRWHDLQDEIHATLVEVCGGAARLWQLYNRVPSDMDTARIAQQSRCNGMALSGYDEWGDPTCQATAVTRDQLCDRCRQRRDHWRRKTGEAA